MANGTRWMKTLHMGRGLSVYCATEGVDIEYEYNEEQGEAFWVVRTGDSTISLASDGFVVHLAGASHGRKA